MLKYTIGILADKEIDDQQELNVLVTINSNLYLEHGNANKLKEVVVSLLAQYTGMDIAIFERDDAPDSVDIDEEDTCILFHVPKRKLA